MARGQTGRAVPWGVVGPKGQKLVTFHVSRRDKICDDATSQTVRPGQRLLRPHSSFLISDVGARTRSWTIPVQEFLGGQVFEQGAEDVKLDEAITLSVAATAPGTFCDRPPIGQAQEVWARIPIHAHATVDSRDLCVARDDGVLNRVIHTLKTTECRWHKRDQHQVRRKTCHGWPHALYAWWCKCTGPRRGKSAQCYFFMEHQRGCRLSCLYKTATQVTIAPRAQENWTN